MLGSRGQANSLRAVDAADIERRQPDATSSTLDQDAFPPVERTHHDKQLIGRDIVHEHRCPHLRTHLRWSQKGVDGRHTDDIGIPAEVCEGQYFLAHMNLRDPFTERINCSSYLIADDTGELGRVGIEAHPRQ